MKNYWKIFGVLLAILLLLVIASSGCISNSGTVSAGSSGGSYSTPVPTSQPSTLTLYVGDAMEMTGYAGHIIWSVDQVIRGNQANSIVASGNMFNSKPDSGYEYLLYKISVTNLDSKKYSVYSYCWPAYADGVETSNEFVVLPDTYLSLASGDILSGATTSGWIVVQVPTGSSVRIYYDPLFGDLYESGYFII